jgi:hypothetical protein
MHHPATCIRSPGEGDCQVSSNDLSSDDIMARASTKNGGRNGATELLRAVGRKLRLRRIERGLTLQAVSKRTGS